MLTARSGRSNFKTNFLTKESSMIYDKKPWLKSYDHDVNAEIDIPDISLKDYFMDSFTQYQDRVGCHYLGTTMTFWGAH